MDAIALIQDLAARDRENSRVQKALKEASGLIGQGIDALEGLLTDACKQASPGLREPCLHIIEAGGKRIRPAVCLLSYRAAGGVDPLPLDLAVSCELLHNSTLLHDDVIDDGDVRRGRPSAKVVYGNALSVLGGDYLLVQTVEIVAKRDQIFMAPFVRTLRHLIEGELIQLKRRGSVETTVEEYFRIIEGKTASLFSWAARSGAIAAGGSEEICEQLGRFGWHVGVAFQVIDDILDLSAGASQLGKSLLADIREGKMTLPVILACQMSEKIKRLLDQLIEGEDPAAVAPKVAELVKKSGTIEQARIRATEHTNQALQILDDLSGLENRAAQILEELSKALLERDY